MIIILILSLAFIAIDQITKFIVVSNMSLYEKREVIKEFFFFTYLRNDGIAFGFDIPLFIRIIITIIALAVIGYFIYKYRDFKKNKWIGISLSLILGGTIGNFIDRLFQTDHSVIDFFNFYIYYPWIENSKFVFNYIDFAVFNVADACLNIGVFMMLFYILFIEPKKNKKEKSSNEDVTIKVE